MFLFLFVAFRVSSCVLVRRLVFLEFVLFVLNFVRCSVCYLVSLSLLLSFVRVLCAQMLVYKRLGALWGFFFFFD